eukprot:2532028-Heterocapsa_arctica.AAC.1
MGRGRCSRDQGNPLGPYRQNDPSGGRRHPRRPRPSTSVLVRTSGRQDVRSSRTSGRHGRHGRHGRQDVTD